MVGPFMQGMLLMGIIYWYSKGLINLINDYYRGEFNRKLTTEIKQQKIAAFRSQKYDLNDMQLLVDIEIKEEKFSNEELNFVVNKTKNNLVMNDTNNMKICYRLNSKKEFLNILFAICNKIDTFKNPICWLNDNDTTYFYSNTNLYSEANKEI